MTKKTKKISRKPSKTAPGDVPVQLDDVSRWIPPPDERTARELLGKESTAKELSERNGKIAGMWNDIRDSFAMLGKIFSGEFKDYAWTDVAVIVAGLAYLLCPVDAIPDAIPVVGLSDDAGFLALAFSKARKCLRAFQVFMKAARAYTQGAVLAKKLVDNIGLPDSLSETFKRKACTRFVTHAPPPGTPLVVSLAKMLEHSGIYLGNDQVAELYSGDEGGVLRIVSVGDFLGCNGLRTGDRVYAACVEGKDGPMPLGDAGAARWARRVLKESPEIAYNIFRSNCHMFTASCLSRKLLNRRRNGVETFREKVGKNADSLIQAAILGTFTIKSLMEVVQQQLGKDRPVVWCPVEQWTRTSLIP